MAQNSIPWNRWWHIPQQQHAYGYQQQLPNHPPPNHPPPPNGQQHGYFHRTSTPPMAPQPQAASFSAAQAASSMTLSMKLRAAVTNTTWFHEHPLELAQYSQQTTNFPCSTYVIQTNSELKREDEATDRILKQHEMEDREASKKGYKEG